MADILQFPGSQKDEGYTYFSKAIVDSIVSDKEDGADYRIVVCDEFGRMHEVIGAQVIEEDKSIILQILGYQE